MNEIVFTIILIAVFLVVIITPGYTILFVVSRFTTGRPAYRSSIAVSSVYYVIVWVTLDLGNILNVGVQILDHEIRWQTAAVLVGGPIAIGLVAGLCSQKDLLYRLLRFVKTEPVHNVPSAWDWKFMRAEQQWITMKLNDGKTILALYDENCFVSTDPNERDLYLSNVYEWDEDGYPVKDERIGGLLLKADTIDRIEFHEGTSN